MQPSKKMGMPGQAEAQFLIHLSISDKSIEESAFPFGYD